jgi:uncharacterized protein YjdB/alpha-tubulin suppressor-like RCC1 family protein
VALITSFIASLLATAAPLRAQKIGVNVFDSAKVSIAAGAKLAVPIRIDLLRAGTLNLASLQAGVSWNADRLTFDSIRVVSSTGFAQTANTSGTSAGGLVVNLFSATALEASGPLTNLFFTASAAGGAARITLSPSAAGSDVGEDMMSSLLVRNLDVCIGGSGKWGDVNDDLNVNIIDAQQIARASVGLSVASPSALSARGDVTADGVVNVIDAQQIARYTVGLTAATRVNTVAGSSLAVASVVLAPSTLSLITGAVASLSAEPRDATGISAAGCASIVWSSSNAAVAAVSSSGVVTAVSPGTATITALSEGKSATAAVTVAAPSLPTASVVVTPSSTTLRAGQNVQITAAARDSLGQPITGRSVAWSSSNVSVASVSATGAITGVSAGSATVSALIEGKTAAVSVTVTPDLASGTAQGTGPSIAVGDLFSCALDATGKAYCWGSNASGQLGDGTFVNKTAPTAVSGGISFRSIIAGSAHACGLASSGAVFCWGRNQSQSLGINSTDTLPKNTPQLAAGGQQFASLYGGSFGTGACALTAAGGAYCWGQTLVGSGLGAEQAPGMTFVQLAVGGGHVCGLQADGAAYCWGEQSSGQLGDGVVLSVNRKAGVTPVLGNLRFNSLSAGSVTSCGVTMTAESYCWGWLNNDAGGKTSTPIPTRVSGAIPFAVLDQTDDFQCGLSALGDGYCWGSNLFGQLGDGTTTTRYSFNALPGLVAGGLTFQEIATSQGGAHSCAKVATGAVYCWGRNAQGQIGNGTLVNALQPALVSGSSGYKLPSMDVDAIAFPPSAPLLYVGRTASLISLPKDTSGRFLAGRPVTWSSLDGTKATVTSTGTATGIGQGAVAFTASSGGRSASLPANVFAASVSLLQISPSAPSIFDAQGIQMTATAIDSSGVPLANRVFTWESSDTMVVRVSSGGVLSGVGAGSATVRARSEGKVGQVIATGLLRRVVSVGVAPVTLAIAAGQSNQLEAVLRDSTGARIFGRTIAWSSSNAGVAVVSPIGKVTALSAGTAVVTMTSASLTASATITVTGGSTAIPDDGYTMTAGFNGWACGISAPGSAYCWGNNVDGAIGDGTRTNRTLPTAVAGGFQFDAISAGANHTCGLTTSGVALCWGSDSLAQLGNGVGRADALTPVPVVGARGFKALAAGGLHTCALTTAGAAYCWGDNTDGQLGDGTTASREEPVLVSGGLVFRQLTAGMSHTCGLTAAGAAYCWGRNNLGAVGNGTFTSTATPALVTGGKSFVSLSLGRAFTCGLATDGNTYCWGYNVAGMIGDGTTTNRESPTLVSGGLTFATVVADGFSACGLTSAGSAYCWGSNSAGDIGDGGWTPSGSANRLTPVAVSGTNVFRYLSDGLGAYRCGVIAGGSASCWGNLTGLGTSGVPTALSGGVTFRLPNAAVSSVELAPATATRFVGQSITGAATVRDASGRLLAGRTISWTSANPAVAQVSSAGVVSAIGAGSTTITATSEGRSATMAVTVVAVPVASVAMQPSSVSLTVGLTAQLAATAKDSIGGALLGRSAVWSSSAAGVATVAQNGLVTAVGGGTAVITATVEGKVATASVTVVQPIVAAQVVVSPSVVSLRVGQTTAIAATVLDGGGVTMPGKSVTWSSNNAAVASVSSAGLISAIGAGSAVVSATSDGRSGTVAVSVADTLRTVAAVILTTPTTTFLTGQTSAFTALALDRDSVTLTGRVVSWSSSNSAVATVSPTGVVTAVGNGTAQITAAVDAQSAAVTIASSTPVITAASVVMTPTTASLLRGQSVTVNAVPVDAAGNKVTGRTLVWASANAAVASVSQSGVVTALTTGSTSITATADGRVGSTAVNVATIPVANVAVAPSGASVLVGGSSQLSTILTDSAGVVLTNRGISWISGDPKIASVSSTGVVTGNGIGVVTVTAYSEGRVGTSQVTVYQPVRVENVVVDPPSVTLTVGQNITMGAIYRDASGNLLQDRVANWSSSTTAVASVNSTSGVLSALAPGLTTVTVVVDGLLATSSVRVTALPGPVASIALSPTASTLVVTKTLQIDPLLTDSSGTRLFGRTVTWASSNPAVASVTSAGVVTGANIGLVTITASSEGKFATAQVNVVPMPVAQVVVSPSAATKIIGQTINMAAVLRDSSGNVLTGRPIAWSVTPTNVAYISPLGVFTASAPGAAIVSARSEGVTGTAAIAVINKPVITVAVTPPTSSVQAGGRVQLAATAYDSLGCGNWPAPCGIISGRTIAWSTSTPALVDVDSNGMVTTKLDGVAIIAATIDGKVGQASVSIARRAPASVDVTPKARNVAVGQSAQLTAVARDSVGNVLTGRAFDWVSANPAVAAINQQGVVTPFQWGTVTFSASTEGTTGTTTVVITDTIWKKIGTLPTALANGAMQAEYDPATGTLFMGARPFDGAIWKRDPFGAWSRITAPQSTFGTCVTLHFDPVTGDLIVAGCGGSTYRVRVSDGQVTLDNSLNGGAGGELHTVWDAVAQKVISPLVPNRGTPVVGVGVNTILDAATRTYYQLGVTKSYATGYEYRRVVACQGGCVQYVKIEKPALWQYLDLWSQNVVSGTWTQLFTGPDRSNLQEPDVDDVRLAVCDGRNTLVRFDTKTRGVARWRLGISSTFSYFAQFTPPQAEPSLGISNTSLICDGARQRIWVIEATTNGGGIWEYPLPPS